MRIFGLTLLLILGISGCTSIDDAPTTSSATFSEEPQHWQQHLQSISQLENWELSGKVGVVTPKQNQTGYIDWQQDHQAFSISIRGTLGFGGLDLFGDQQFVTIKVDENNQRTLPTDIALERYLNWEFPINSLKYWVKGIPDPNAPVSNQQFNGQGQLARLQQQGWDIRLINYERHADKDQTPVFLPHKIIARYNGHKVSLVLSEWTLNPTTK
ncbi:lipoprotein insertase outer membrane protein LolB [Litoribrevibacter euphylliae]|uniref:Outer-membrane lipoprotein LolB n=1 Tax=Litoribrevibacter euphylliae TaxID=1834034 RepID=A0ABV7HH11_9GAMM